ncbi:MAG: HD domain-containing protein [Planctomycetes bacterium]|nr:HD domain-containing protein [Planctomycetota bacterium]MCB9870925.1 HD domain-containing protein [Planctomycetota bacterium]
MDDLFFNRDPDEPDAPRTPEAIVTELVDNLVASLINARIYWTNHPRVLASLQTVISLLQEACVKTAKESVAVAVSTDFLVFDDRPLLGASIAAPRLIKALDEWSSGGLKLSKSATVADLEVLLEAIRAAPAEGNGYEQINEKLRRGSRQPIELLPVYREIEDGVEGKPPELRGKCVVPLQLYQSAMDLLQGLTVSVSTGKTIDFAPIQTHAELMLQRLESNEGALMNLARQDHYDAFTFGHSVRVSVLALNFGRSLTKDSGALIQLGTAALLHDVGKAMVPFEVLHSNKALSAEERAEICRHPEYGAQILLDHEHCDPHAISATFGHHCAHGHRGYPKTLHEHRVSMVTDIVGIVDVFEALTAARPYKRPMSPVRAYRIMMGMEDKFDRRLLKRFIQCNGIHPNGQLIQLSSGERARVMRQTTDIAAPIVKVETDREGNFLLPTEQWDLDLSVQSTQVFHVTEQLAEDPATLVSSA